MQSLGWSLELRSRKCSTGRRAMQRGAMFPDPKSLSQHRPRLYRHRSRPAPAVSLRKITMTADPEARGKAPLNQALVLYDGVCGLCNRLVVFLLRHDRRDQFRFAPLQSDFARTQLHRYGLNSPDFNTFVVLADFQQDSERALTRSQAALWAVTQVGGPWKFFAVAKLIPLRLRDAFYRFIASRRYRIFGKYDQCPVPQASDRHKFLG